MIIANVLPTFAAAHETLSTLQFASRAKHIRNKAIVNEDTNGELALLQRELHRLRRWAIMLQSVACGSLRIHCILPGCLGTVRVSQPSICPLLVPFALYLSQGVFIMSSSRGRCFKDTLEQYNAHQQIC